MNAIRHTSLFAVLAMILGLAAGVHAADSGKDTGFQPFNDAAFAQAQKDGKHIVLEVFKKGCPTCAAQQPALREANKQHPDAVLMKFDFVNDTDTVQRFKVVMQSTIIVFKGENEVARLVGETDDEAILSAISKGS